MAQEWTEQYLISDAAKQVEVETHVLRYWEEELKLPIQRNKLGHRYYTKEDVERFRIIKKWKEQGLQLKAIRSALKDPKGSIWSVMQAEFGQEEPEQAQSIQAKDRQEQNKQAEDQQGQENEESEAAFEENRKEGENKMASKEMMDEEIMSKKENSADAQTAPEELPEDAGKEKHIRRSVAKGKSRKSKKNRQKVNVVRWDSKRAEAALEKLDLQKQPDTEQDVLIHMPDTIAEKADPAKKTVIETKEAEVQETEMQKTEAGEAEKIKEDKGKIQENEAIESSEKEPAKNFKKQQAEAEQPNGQETVLSGDTVKTAEILAEEEKDRKAARFQFLLSQMMKEAVRSNNEDLLSSVQELVAKEMDFQFRQQEEREQEREQQRLKREEEHYKKIDALLRTRSEQAAERKKKRPLFGWN